MLPKTRKCTQEFYLARSLRKLGPTVYYVCISTVCTYYKVDCGLATLLYSSVPAPVAPPMLLLPADAPSYYLVVVLLFPDFWLLLFGFISPLPTLLDPRELFPRISICLVERKKEDPRPAGHEILSNEVNRPAQPILQGLFKRY